MATTKISTGVLKDGSVTSAKLDTNISIVGDLTVDTNALFVDSASNNVGIGTSSPAYKLDVSGTIGATGAATFASSVTATGLNAVGLPSNGGTINIGDTAAYRGILSYTGASVTTLSLSNTYDTATSRIDFNLRTTGTPVTALRLEGSGNATFAGSVALFNAQPMFFYSTPTTLNYELLSIDKQSAGNARLRVYKSGTGSYRGFEIQTGGSASLIIDSTGNVGIGTSSPATKLDVVGTYRMQFRTDDAIPELRAITANGASFKELGLNGSQLVFNISSAERMRIDASGNVGINTSSPAALQEIFLTSGGKALRLNSNFANGNPVDLNPYVTGLNNGGFEIRINDAPKLVIWTNDDLHAVGDVIAYSTTISDERLKDDIQTIDNALDKVSNLRGVSYTWNNGSRKGQKDLGLIAQEVEQVLPELVREKEMPMIDGGTYKTIDYEKIVGVLIEAIKELKAEVESLKSK